MRKKAWVALLLVCLGGVATAQRHGSFRTRGFYSAIDFGYAFNLNRGEGLNHEADTVAGYEMGISCGYQFSKEAGVGAGITYISDQNSAFNIMPAFVELRSHYLKSNLSPYTVVQVGYSIPLGASATHVKIEKGGVYFGVAAGVRYSFSKAIALGIHGGYQLVNLRQVDRYNGEPTPWLTGATTLSIINAGLTLYF